MGHDDENSPGAKMAVLRNEVKHVNETVIRMESKMDQFIANGVTQAQLSASQALADQKHLEIQAEIAEVKQTANELVQWRNSLTTKVAATAIMVFVAMVLALYGLDKFL